MGGIEETVEEFTDASGRKMKKITKVIKDKDGNDITVETTIDQNGNKKKKKPKNI